MAHAIVGTPAATAAETAAHARVIITRNHLPRTWNAAASEGVVSAVKRRQERPSWGGLTETVLDIAVVAPDQPVRTYRLAAGVAQRHALSFGEMIRLLRDANVSVALRIDARYDDAATEVMDFSFHPDCDLDLT